MSEFKLEDLRKLIGTEKIAKTRQSKPKPQSIHNESDRPSPKIVSISLGLKSLPTPKYSIGSIVILPTNICGVVQFVVYEPVLMTWVYAIFLEDEPEKVHYLPEGNITLSKYN